MADKYYSIPNKPVYSRNVRELQNDDPSNAELTFNPLILQLLENIAAVKELADSALRLAQPRKIGNASFDGSADITLAQIGAAAASHGTHVSYSTDAPKAAGTAAAGSSGAVARSDHVHPEQTNISGNAGTANKLKTARKIGNASFDGSADVTLAQMGAADSGHTHGNMKAATASAAGGAGLVPAPAAGAQAKYLRGDGTWQNPPNTTYSAATQSANGLMSAADKTKLDKIAAEANKYSHPTSVGNKHIPAGGSSGQILRWSSDGTAAWGADNNTTYGTGTASISGLTKLYTGTGSATDGTMTQKAQTEKLNAKQNIKRGTVGQSGSTTTDPWYKFASCTVNGAYEDRWVTFAVTTGYGDASNTVGILTAHFRTNSTKVWESGELKWQVAGSGIDPAKFVIAYKNTANTSCAVELWAKIDSGYRYYHFDVISEGNRSVFGDYWILHSLSAAGSASSPSTGFTQIASTVLELKNSVSGNAESASRWQNFRRINGLLVNGSVDVASYAICSTSAGAAAKTAEMVIGCVVSLVAGAEITVKFTKGNTAANPTLNVNGAGAKPIYYRGAPIHAKYLNTNGIYTFRYNGTQYELVGDAGVYRDIIGIPQKSSWTYSSTYKIYMYEYSLTGNWINRAVIPYGSNYDSLPAPIKFYGNIDTIDMETTQPPDSANSISIIIL